MNIAGLVKTSLVDYPGKIAAVVFTQGCNLRCTYCHNLSLLDRNVAASGPSAAEVGRFLAKRQGLIEAVVISGGEPTLQQEFPLFAEELKRLNLLVKLDTNGTNPDLLRTLLRHKLVDFLALDLKAPCGKYEKITGSSPWELKAIRGSAEVVKHCGVDHEFRTTLCPELTTGDIAEICEDFGITSHYVVQSCRDRELKKITGNRQDEQKLRAWAKENFPLALRGFEAG